MCFPAWCHLCKPVSTCTRQTQQKITAETSCLVHHLRVRSFPQRFSELYRPCWCKNQKSISGWKLPFISTVLVSYQCQTSAFKIIQQSIQNSLVSSEVVLSHCTAVMWTQLDMCNWPKRCSTNRTWQTARGVDLTSILPWTQFYWASIERAGTSLIHGGATSHPRGLTGPRHLWIPSEVLCPWPDGSEPSSVHSVASRDPTCSVTSLQMFRWIGILICLIFVCKNHRSRWNRCHMYYWSERKRCVWQVL